MGVSPFLVLLNWCSSRAGVSVVPGPGRAPGAVREPPASPGATTECGVGTRGCCESPHPLATPCVTQESFQLKFPSLVDGKGGSSPLEGNDGEDRACCCLNSETFPAGVSLQTL